MDEEEIRTIADGAIRPLKRVLYIFCCTIGVVNIVALIWFTPIFFQRLGSLWVAILIGLFGFSRMVMFGIKSLIDDPSEEKLFLLQKGRDPFSSRFGISSESKEILTNAESNQQARHLLNLLDNRMTFEVFKVEISWLVGATIQWGYGDLIHEGIHALR